MENKRELGTTKVHPRFKLKKQVSPFADIREEKVRFWIYLLHICQKKKKTFVDVYCGGGSVGLSLLLSGVVEHLVMNDLDKGVYAFFHTVLTAPKL